jgi:hypothetical protein
MIQLQQTSFWQAYQVARAMHAGSGVSIETLAATTAESWNTRHVQSLTDHTMSIGLGGMLRVSHARDIIRAKGLQVEAFQVGGTTQYQPSQVAPTRKRLRKDDIECLSYADTVPFLRDMNLSVQNTKSKRQAQLLQHFDGKPDDYELCL